MAKFLKAGKVGTYHFQFLDIKKKACNCGIRNPSY